jgi:C1A family cysteine protease
MPLNQNSLGWLPDYPDQRDLKLSDLNNNIIKDQSQNSEYTASQILELAELIKKIVPNTDQKEKKSLDESLERIIQTNRDEICFLKVQKENKYFLHRGIKNTKVKEIQGKLSFILDKCCPYLDPESSTKIKDHLEKLKLENGYFGEITHELMLGFKTIWEITSKNSILDVDDQTKANQEEEFYQYDSKVNIYQVLNTIFNRIKNNEKNHNEIENNFEETFRNFQKEKNIDNFSEIKIGDYGKIVNLIKTQLEELGYWKFSPEDQKCRFFFGFKTDLIVEFFQGINGLQADGIVGPSTWRKLCQKNKAINLSQVKDIQNLKAFSMIYIQKRLSNYFGCENIKFNGIFDEVTQKAIEKIIESQSEEQSQISTVQKILRKIIEKAEDEKQYFLDPLFTFPEYNNQDFSQNQEKKNPILLSIQNPISKKIKKDFKEKIQLKLENSQEDQTLEIKNQSSNNPLPNDIIAIIDPLIQLVIKQISEMGIHGQLNYEQAIPHVIELINSFLAKPLENTAKYTEDYPQQPQFLDNYDMNTKFFLEFLRGRKERACEIDMMLIYKSLSTTEIKRLNYSIFITLDKIEWMIDEIEAKTLEGEKNNLDNSKAQIKLKAQIKELKTKVQEYKKLIQTYFSNKQNEALIDRSNQDENQFDFFPKKNQTTILKKCPDGEPNQSSDQDHQLSVPLLTKFKNSINKYEQSYTSVYFCLPEFVDLSYWCSPVRNQEPLSSCTACSAIALVEYFQNRIYGEYTNASVLFLYKVTRQLMHRQGDVGASIRETMKAMVLFGIPPEEYWPYEPSKIDEEPSGFCYSYGQIYQTIKYFRLDTLGLPATDLLAQIKMTLVAGLPSMFGLTIYSSIYEEANYKKGYIPLPHSKDNVQGGHAVVAIGYDDSKIIGTSVGALLIRNSWGTNWGEQGYGWLPYDYILKGLTSDWWSLIKAEWFETKNFGLGANDWKHNDTGTDKPPKQPGG